VFHELVTPEQEISLEGVGGVVLTSLGGQSCGFSMTPSSEMQVELMIFRIGVLPYPCLVVSIRP
jgi:hypothetical protein